MPHGTTDLKRAPQLLFAGAILCGILLFVAVIGILGPTGLAAMVAAAGAAVLVFAHPLIPFSIYFGALFFESTVLPGIPVSLNQLIAPLFLLSVIAYAIRGQTLPLRFSLLPLFVIVALYFGINGLFGQNFENGLLYSRYVIVYMVIAICIAVSMSRERNILALAWIITLLTGFAAGHGVYEALQKDILGKFTGNWGYQVRVQGTAANPIVYGWNMVYGFPFAFLLFAEMRSRSTRALAILMGLLIITAAFLTFNRQTFVVIAVSVVLCSLLYNYKNRKVFFAVISSFLALLSVAILPLIIKRFLTVTTLGKDLSFLERKDSFLIGIEMIKEKPLTGIGFGSFPKEWRNFLPPDYSTYFAQYRAPQAEKFLDLGFMQVLVETGIIGLLLYAGLIAVILLKCYKYRKAAVAAGDTFAQNLASTALVIGVFLALTSMIQDTFLYTRVWVFYGIVMLLDKRVLPPINDSLKRTGEPGGELS